MKVYIFGAKGMLGRYVQNALSCFEIVPFSRSDFDINDFERILPYLHKLGMENGEVIINCAAILKSRIADVGIEETIKVNSLFPHALSNYCSEHGIKLIHLSTDTVFSGRRGTNQIFTINPDGTDLTQLTHTGNNEDPSFAPDGMYIAFCSDRDGGKGIYIMRSDGEAQQRITPHTIQASSPRWSPN